MATNLIVYTKLLRIEPVVFKNWTNVIFISENSIANFPNWEEKQ